MVLVDNQKFCLSSLGCLKYMLDGKAVQAQQKICGLMQKWGSDTNGKEMGKEKSISDLQNGVFLPVFLI